jgi:hypothetical protein
MTLPITLSLIAFLLCLMRANRSTMTARERAEEDMEQMEAVSVRFSAYGTPYVTSAVSAVSPERMRELVRRVKG